eukprot:scaffold110988_cov39-Phaeocystis_antarctica.AAC.1
MTSNPHPNPHLNPHLSPNPNQALDDLGQSRQERALVDRAAQQYIIVAPLARAAAPRHGPAQPAPRRRQLVWAWGSS